jgi:drug/metabolite transporter (DMT)-like permease
VPTRIDRRIWIALGLVYVVWGSTYLAIRVADRTIPPFLMAGVRFLVAGGLLFAWSAGRRGQVPDRLGARQWVAATVIGALLLGGGNGGVVWAEQRVPSGITALLIATVPLWMAVLSALLDRRWIAGRVVGGVVVGFAGTALLVHAAGSRAGRVSGVGVAVALVGAIAWALGSVLSQRLALPRRPLVATAMEMLCGGAVLVLMGLVAGELHGFHPGRVSFESFAGFLYLIVFGSWVGFTAYVWLLKNTTTSLVSTYAYVNPVIAVLLGWALLNERITGLTLLAAVLIVGAVALIVLAQGRERARDAGRGVSPLQAVEPVQASPADAPAVRGEAAP